MNEKYSPKNLLLTERGEQWLSNFDDQDKPTARRLVAALTLISETEFERNLQKMIEEEAKKSDGPVGLFGVREVDNANGEHIFSSAGDGINSTPVGTDIGSEGRIATIIRNLSRLHPKKILNHPTWEKMRDSKCHVVFFIDDFIGSGKRVTGYISDFYNYPTIKSWHSYGLLHANVLAYSGTADGIKRIEEGKMHPLVTIVRSCSTVKNNVRIEEYRAEVEELCRSYAKRAKFRYSLGFGQTGALMVFEHSCPNNCPMILWGGDGESGSQWNPLFFSKSVQSEAKTVFPPEIVREEPVSALIAAGEKRIAAGARNLINRPLPAEWLIVLALFSRGVRRIDAVEQSTGLNRKDAAEVIEKCVQSGLLTQKWRLSNFGSQELRSSRKAALIGGERLVKGAQTEYYPIALRSRRPC